MHKLITKHLESLAFIITNWVSVPWPVIDLGGTYALLIITFILDIKVHNSIQYVHSKVISMGIVIKKNIQ